MDYPDLLHTPVAVGLGTTDFAVAVAAGFGAEQVDDAGRWRRAGRLDGVPAAILAALAQAVEQDRVVADARALRFRQLQGAIADTARR
ncbi:hypothetical protein D3C71_1624700 [compost metagenome]